MEKLTDRIADWSGTKSGRPCFSLEFFPPKTETGLFNLYERIERYAALSPLWIDVTCGGERCQRRGEAPDVTCRWLREKTLEICTNAMKYHGLIPLIHVTCTNTSIAQIEDFLEQCKSAGIRNIMALRGDPTIRQGAWEAPDDGFSYAVDLVKLIRRKYGDYFCIAVAGYPEGHLESATFEEDLLHMKEKVDAGADLIITQLFYDVDTFLNFQRRARALGVSVPIIPGILPIQSYAGLMKMTALCRTQVPPRILTELEAIKLDDQKVKDYGISLCVEMCKRLLTDSTVPGFHFYTLNLEVSVMKVLADLQLIESHVSSRQLPWRPLLAGERAKKERVRPIFWALRKSSYIDRTAQWDDFPNGRWGDRRSPAFGEPPRGMGSLQLPLEHLIAMWGATLESDRDIIAVFIRYINAHLDLGGSRSEETTPMRLPWCKDSLGEETFIIRKQLKKLNYSGLCTINSQPRVNACPSSDPVFGWGAKGGVVYQKAYVEFFCSQETFLKLKSELFPLWPSWSFMATRATGLVESSSAAETNAVTWGVFPGAEIKQPTVVDRESFAVWKEEAFALWLDEWRPVYDKGTKSWDVITQIHDTWYLVNIVDDNFMTGEIFTELAEFVSRAIAS